MADISLREYLAKLDTLLNSGSAAEVILHCRHILQYFPKNAQAYRLLGRALVATSRWTEAGEVMRRVLSVFPDDRDAHAGLSEVYRIEKRPDDAIWHLERAFEQAPNDQDILERLRELYRRYRKVEHGKVQLTAAAVARQYIRNGLYEQAIDTLQKARATSPERIDLPLLLAQTYWDRGQRVEAAQTALEVLKILPDCLVANTLLAALWLTEARPSDAQRYIGRIESLDPYLALELAQGEDVDDSAFKLEELDYQLAAEREMSSQRPDWLTDFNASGDMQEQEPEAEVEEDSFSFLNDLSPDDVVATENFKTNLTAEEWGDVDPRFLDDAPTVRKSTGGLSGLTGRIEKPATGSLGTAPTSVPGAKRGLTGRLTPLPEQMPAPEPMPSFMDEILASTPDQLAPTDDEPTFTGELPDLASLVPPAEIPDEELPFRRERTIQSDADSDPLAWLRSSGVEIDEQAPARADNDIFGAEEDNLALQEADHADPLAWLQGYGDDMIVEQDAPVPAAPYVSTDELPASDDDDPLAWLHATENVPSSAELNDDEPLDWLSDDSLLDEAFNLESLVNNQSPTLAQPLSTADDSPTAATPEWQDTMADEKDPLDWLSSEPESEPEPSDSFTWMDTSSASEVAPAEDFPDWLNASETVDAVGSGEVDDIEWMSDLPDLDSSETTQPASTGVTGMLDWLGKEPAPEPDLPTMTPADTAAPDWLSELQPDAKPDAGNTIDENGFEWMSTADELPTVGDKSEVPDWLSAAEAEVEPEVEAFGTADIPNWIASIDENTAKGSQPLSDDTPEWLSAEPASELTAAADTPDWLSSMEISEPEAQLSTTDWLSSMRSTDDEPEAEPIAAADTPDWLSALPHDDEPEAEPITAADTPDWLSSMAPAEDEPEAEPITAADTPDWLSALPHDDEPEAEPIAAADTPDWLSSMAPAED
ncbi:MAG: tetratricopeptide repeat protein, partial [Anaerolineae bacterium]|nr:tetratricopeptide repeat protein [Anaerolineae bacterium]